ncbi:MAG: hypothetical protein JNL39_15035 [Opitutaceae bacterium]|nr:hypothetical protein [Opitutaceae bacterium]
MPNAIRASTASAPSWSRAAIIGLAAMVGVSAVVRGAAMGNSLWLDEVWTLRNIAELKSASGIFTQFLNDNNHPLASLWMYVARDTTADWLHRLPAWLAGIACVWLAGEIGRAQFRRVRPAAPSAGSDAAGLIAAALVASAYMLTVYFSEARGYGPMLAGALLAILALLRDPDGETWRWPILYWFACALGLLAHATVVNVMAGGAAWSLVRAVGGAAKPGAWLRALRWHAVPMTGAAIYYAAFLRHLGIGGGPETTALAVVGEAVSFTVGLPAHLALTAAAIIALITGLGWLWPRSRELAALYFVTVVAAPLATIMFSRFSLLFPRYLILSCAGALLVGGIFLALLWRRNRLAAVAIVALVIAGQTPSTLELLRHGRGDFRAVLRHLASGTRTPEISVCSDHDNRTLPLIQRYAPSTLTGRPIRYVPGNSPRRHAARWLLVADVGDTTPGPEARDAAGNTFTLEASLPHAPLSGSGWLIYRDRTFPDP